jgi:MOSC domain-containing protein YiiM
MAHVSLFIGGIRPLPESGRPTGIYKQPAAGTLELGREGFVGDEQADRRVHGGPEKAVHLYPAAHYARLAEKFPDASTQLVIGSLGENMSTAELDESDVRIGEIWRLGSAQLQVCQPRNPCWKIDERFASEGMAAFIAEHGLTGWYWRVLVPGQVPPGATLDRLVAADDSLTLAAAMRLWQAHRPELAELEKLAASPGIAQNWQQKIMARIEWLRKNSESTSAQTPAFHTKPEKP